MPANTSRLFKLHVHCGRAVGPWKSFILFTRSTPKKQHNLSSLSCRGRVYFRVSISTASSAFFGFMMPSTLDLYALRHFSLLCTRGYQSWILAIYPVLHLPRSHQSLRFCASRVLFLVLGFADPKFKVQGSRLRFYKCKSQTIQPHLPTTTPMLSVGEGGLSTLHQQRADNSSNV